MTFFLIVPSVMIVGVFLVHGVFNRLGLRMHFGALIICAVLSIAADVGAAILSPAPGRNYFINLGGLILAAALLATLTNYFLVRRKIAAEKFTAETRAAYLEDLAERIERAEEVIKPEKSPEPEPAPRPKVSLVKKYKPKKILKPAAKIKPVEPAKVEPIKKVEPVKVEVKKIEPVKVEATKKIEPVKKSEPIKKVEPPKILATTAEGKVVKKFEPEKISKPEKVSKPSPPPIKKIEPTETLDDLLELAYSEKSQGHTWQAIAAYQKALEKYRNDDYAPFVAIDLGNVYKEQAMYAKAIKTFEEALELPAVKRNAKTAADFKKNIVYLRTVQSVLLRHQALTTPFSRISKIYLREIETEFQSTQADLN